MTEGKGLLNLSPEEADKFMKAIEDSNDESLLPMHNGATVIRADIKAGTNPGDGQGEVLAQTPDGKYVTWWVRRDAGDPKWHAFHGDYHRNLLEAVRSYNERRGVEF